ncbi:hypothetical protein [Flavobacterium caeni]|uniref:Uncharacterized protein n=1 Tax=Flavobacterium caeni TaxID=490189 RepID=A0A1G5G9Z0_9FLAO|nr:hypothetical protein [Flavobacterium caeni]SCY48314.1 hypothetical protein SAMN02927903_01500 [Flavobacterium caeni]
MMRIFLFAAIGLLTACDKDDQNAMPYYVAPAGTADVTLTMTGGSTYELDGPCGWAYAGGVGYVGANQTDNSLKTFSIDTNLTELPSVTTTFTLTDDALDEDPTKARIHLTEFVGSSFVSWDSTTASGQVTFAVNGNEVTVDLSGITLEAESSNDVPYDNNGTLSGTLKFYK